VGHLETKNAANEAKILQQEEEIVKLKAKIDSKCSSDFANNSPNNNKMSLTDKIESLPDGSLPRDVLPSSCRDLALVIPCTASIWSKTSSQIRLKPSTAILKLLVSVQSIF